MGRDRALGYATVLILRAIHRGNRYGFDIIEATGLASGTVYPTLGRVEKRGYLRARWEDRELATRDGRPRRRYYTVTKPGELALGEAVRRFGQLGDDAAVDGSFAHGGSQ